MADSSERYVVVLHAGCWHTSFAVHAPVSLSLLGAIQVCRSIKVCLASFKWKFSFTGHLLIDECIDLD